MGNVFFDLEHQILYEINLDGTRTTLSQNTFVDHCGTEYPSFKAMCKHWDKHPDTIRRRLHQGWPLNHALEYIPTLPGHWFSWAFCGLNGLWYYEVHISPKYSVQHKKLEKHKPTNYHNRPVNHYLLSAESIKDLFPKDKKQLAKARMLGIY